MNTDKFDPTKWDTMAEHISPDRQKTAKSDSDKDAKMDLDEISKQIFGAAKKDIVRTYSCPHCNNTFNMSFKTEDDLKMFDAKFGSLICSNCNTPFGASKSTGGVAGGTGGNSGQGTSAVGGGQGVNVGGGIGVRGNVNANAELINAKYSEMSKLKSSKNLFMVLMIVFTVTTIIIAGAGVFAAAAGDLILVVVFGSLYSSKKKKLKQAEAELQELQQGTQR